MRCSKHFCIDFHFIIFISMHKFDCCWSVIFFYFAILLVLKSKINQQASISTATRNSSFQIVCVYSSAFSNRSMHFQILVPILKYIALISLLSLEICHLNYSTFCILLWVVILYSLVSWYKHLGGMHAHCAWQHISSLTHWGRGI